MWRPLSGPHVNISFATNDTCHMPTRPQSCQPTPATCHTAPPRQHPYELYSQHIFFLLVCRFEQNAISLSFNVCLNPNEFHWVHDDEAYAPVRSEAILSTLNFWAKFDPLDHTSPLESFWTSKRLFSIYLKMRVKFPHLSNLNPLGLAWIHPFKTNLKILHISSFWSSHSPVKDGVFMQFCKIF